MKAGVYLTVDRDAYTGRVQLGICVLDENGSGHGHRIAGPKYLGAGEVLMKARIDQEAADEIRQYLDLINEAVVDQ